MLVLRYKDTDIFKILQLFFNINLLIIKYLQLKLSKEIPVRFITDFGYFGNHLIT